jgi:hypothetical protein
MRSPTEEHTGRLKEVDLDRFVCTCSPPQGMENSQDNTLNLLYVPGPVQPFILAQKTSKLASPQGQIAAQQHNTPPQRQRIYHAMVMSFY